MASLAESLASVNASVASSVKSITRTNWPLGWTPSADAINGDPTGLLRMDNLRIDKDGVVGLIDGRVQIFSGFSNFVSALYSKIINGQEFFWVALGAPTTDLVRYNGFVPAYRLEQTPGVSTIIGNDACFGDAFGTVLISSGQLRVKDDTFNPKPLGLLAPNQYTSQYGYIGPTVQVIQPTIINIPWVNTYNVSGTNSGFGPNGFNLQTTGNSTNPNINASGMTVSTNIINLQGYSQVGYNPNSDVFGLSFAVTDQPPSDIVYIELIFFLNGNPSSPNTWDSFYNFTWTTTDLEVSVTKKTPLTATRDQFTYNGTPGYSWANVIGYGIYVQSIQPANCFVGSPVTVTGGNVGGVNGIYNYMQVNVTNNGVYLAKSPVSLLAYNSLGNPAVAQTSISVNQGSVLITPITNDPNANEFWFFRQADPTAPIDPNTGLSTNASSMAWNFVGKATRGQSVFTDNLTDAQVIQQNIDSSSNPNFFLQTLNPNDLQHSPFSAQPNALFDNIVGMEGLFKGRMLYMGVSFIYISDYLNPDAIDLRATLRPSGDTTERNLWIKKVNNDVIILGTTKDLYEITGTFQQLPDGTFDSNIRSVGESHPPLSRDVCNYNGGLYYVAADGLRVSTGSNSINISPQLRHLFTSSSQTLSENSVPRHGVPTAFILPGQGSIVRYPIAAAHNKIYFVLPLVDGTRRLIVYDTFKQNYTLQLTDPVRLFSTQADELLAGYGGGSGNSVWLLDVLPGKGINLGAQGLQFLFRTVFDHFGTPKNRKDLYTLKMTCDTGGGVVNIGMQKDGIGVTEGDETSYVFLGQFSSNGLGTIYIPLGNSPQLTLGNRYSIQIQDQGTSGLNTFKLYELSLEHDIRPEQTTFVRLNATNLGTISRKRITNLPIVLDTLGNLVSFWPVLDGVTFPFVQTNTGSTGKRTVNYTFPSETIATDIGLIVQGPPFEFYNIAFEEIVSEKLPIQQQFLLIPPNNYGVPNRKRHSSYKFQINTLGTPIQFTPIVDGISYPPQSFTTSVRKTVEYFFNTSVDGIDIGGTLSGGLFEFYGVVTPQTVEQLPDRLEFLKIPFSNLGIAAPKRIRMLPLILNTFGSPVTYTPQVDGNFVSPFSQQTFITNDKLTQNYYFTSDVFCTDIGGLLSSNSAPTVPFEFYGFGDPVEVEVLPPARKYDQLGPMVFDKIGKIYGFRIRLIMNGTTTSMPYAILGDTLVQNGVVLISDSFPVTPGADLTYEIFFPKNINATVVRLVLGPTTDSFYRYSAQVKVQTSGMQSHSQWKVIQ